MALYLGTTGLSHPPSCFESILGVTIESVQGSQVYLECIVTSGSFEIVVRPLEFLSSVNLRPPSLEVRGELRESFLTNQGNGLSSQDEGEQGLSLSCVGTLSVPL